MKPPCPICATECADKVTNTPYWRCPSCSCWFQHPAPPKVFTGAHESPGDQMSERDKSINDGLAAHLLTNVMRGNAGRTLDIGAKYPYLASRLKARGCEAWATDGDGLILEYAKTLGVDAICADFEAMPENGEHDLITLIHCFEHLYNPANALRKLRNMIKDDGRVFLRLPDNSVTGYERDLTPGHYTIHPFFHSFSSILELLAQTKNCFVVDDYSPMHGVGQSDIILRPITTRPRLAVGIIARNEERDLPRALESITGVADDVILIDTGSTDRTMAIAEDFGAHVRQYTGASEQDGKGNWRLLNFAQARNEAIADAAAIGNDWYMWLDADDEVKTPVILRRLLYWQQYDCFGGMCHQDGAKWVHHRLWQTKTGITFQGRIHEYPLLDGMKCQAVEQFIIAHDATPSTGEDSNARNMRILQLEFLDNPTTRGAFYIASTHRDGGRPAMAAVWFAKRIEMGVGYRDEYLFALLYWARCLRTIERFDEADEVIQRAIKEETTWAEFHMEHAFIAYARGHHSDAIARVVPALTLDPPPTHLWREFPMYRDQPRRLLSWCHEHMGNITTALHWAKEANKYLTNDADWDLRIARLESLQPPPATLCPHCGKDINDKPAPPVIHKTRPIIGLNRPGAIGDILMTLNLIPALREANPGHDIYYFCDARLGAANALGDYMRAAGVNMVMDTANWQSWSPRFERAINLVGYPLAEGYPEKPMRRHLLEYFANEMGLPVFMSDGAAAFGDIIPPDGVSVALPALTLPTPGIKNDLWFNDGRPFVTFQYRAGWSKYKEWPNDLFAVVKAALPPDVWVVPIDENQGYTLRQSIAIFANAEMHIGIDSFCNHLTNYFWQDELGNGRRVPGVILWGSTQASAAGYPQNINLTRRLPCQPCFRENPEISGAARGPCVNPPRATYADKTPHLCMSSITAEEVAEAVRAMWARVQ